MGDILKEAIADAKAVRETALENAKMALEEAFTPQLKSMLSAKLKEDEFGDEEEFPVTDEDEEFGGEEEVPAEEGYYEDEEVGEEEPVADEFPATDEDEEFGGEEEVPGEEDVVEINGVKYAPVVAEEEGEEVPGEEETGENNLDLESIIKELESELQEQDDAYDETGDKSDKNGGIKSSDLAEGEDEEEETVEEEYEIRLEGEDEDEEPVEEQSDSSKIGNGDNKVDVADANDEEDPEGGPGTKVYSELKEYKEAVKFLKDKLHEVNILNAKLLFTNKLFKQFTLDNNQKLKVVETFDRAQTTREIKLVYSTLAEQFNDNGSIVTRKSIKESASSAVSSTKPSKESRKVITEENQVANRFKKLAGLVK